MDCSIEDIDLELDHLLETIPIKGQYKNLEPINDKISLNNPNLILRPDQNMLDSSILRPNDLFQVTNNHIFDTNENNLIDTDTTFNFNTKLNKLIESLEKDNEEFYMDDQGRTRVFKGRFKPLDDNELDTQINQFLDSDKENMDPVKIRRPKKGFKIQKSLNPLRTFSLHQRSQKRGACRPNHRMLITLKPSIIYKLSKPQIYLVDSSTGSLNDATQFGTELNASNCEEIPLPEDDNEVVQIPTNEDTTNQKMAIIRTFNNKKFTTGDTDVKDRSGFYNKTEFNQYLNTVSTHDTGVEVINQNAPIFRTTKINKKKLVRWPDNDQLEW